MEFYNFLRTFADSWVMLGMLGFFLGTVLWVFRPGSTKAYADVVNIPFRHEDQPAGERIDVDTKSEEARG